MWGAIISVAIIAFILITFIRGKFRDKTPKWVALLVIILPILEWIIISIDEKMGFFFLLCCFVSIPLFIIFSSIKPFQNNQFSTQKSTNSTTNPFLDFIEKQSSGIQFTPFSHPAIPLIFRIYVVIAILFNAKLVGNDDIFSYELRFQILSLIVLFFISLFVFFNRIDISKLKTFSESNDKKFPFKDEEFGKFKLIVNSLIIIVFIFLLFVANAHITVQKIFESRQFLGLNFVLFLNFIAGIFLILSQPFNAIKIFFLKGIDLYRNYIFALFIGVAIVLPLSLIWKGDIPVLMLGFNAILLYNEIRIYKYFLNNK